MQEAALFPHSSLGGRECQELICGSQKEEEKKESQQQVCLSLLWTQTIFGDEQTRREIRLFRGVGGGGMLYVVPSSRANS